MDPAPGLPTAGHVVSARAASPRGEAAPALGAPARPDCHLAFRFEGVRHRYGPHVALDGLSLAVGRGEMVALLGPNGAGKSTTMSLLLGLARPQEGTVEVLGTSPRAAVAGGRVGAMLQTGTGSGLPAGVRVSAALRLVSRLYPRPAPFDATVERAGIGRLLGRRTHQLSGGEAQRVRFALAIAGDPELVLLDEPTAAMDVESRRAFWRMIRQFGAEGRTVLFATHHLQEADQIASRVTVVNHGKVVADGAGASLKAAVASRRIHFVCPDPDEGVLDALEGVTDVSVAGTSVILSSLDSDATISALVRSRVDFHHLEVGSGGLEEAFVRLTEPRCPEAES
jgi:ABC-2 type transport system ATP-binding protein